MTAAASRTRPSDFNMAMETDAGVTRGSGSSAVMKARQSSQALVQDNYSEMKLLKEIVQVTPVIPTIVITPVQILEDILCNQLKVRAKITRSTQTDWNWRIMAERWRHARLIPARTNPMDLAQFKYHLYELQLQTIIRGAEDYLGEEFEGVEKTDEWLKRSWKGKARAKLEMLRAVRPCDKITDTKDLDFNAGDSLMTKNQIKLTGKRLLSKMDVKHDHARRKTRNPSNAKSFQTGMGQMSTDPGSQSPTNPLQAVEESAQERTSLILDPLSTSIPRRPSLDPSRPATDSSGGGSRRASASNLASLQAVNDAVMDGTSRASGTSGTSRNVNQVSSNKSKHISAKKAGATPGTESKRESVNKPWSGSKRGSESKPGSGSSQGSTRPSGQSH